MYFIWIKIKNISFSITLRRHFLKSFYKMVLKKKRKNKKDDDTDTGLFICMGQK